MRRVAIVITTYNAKKHIDPLLESLLASNYDNYYAIFVDDGSTDETVNYLEAYLSKGIHGECMPLEHNERGVARLTGIERAFEVGFDYLLFIDDDMDLSNNLLKEATEYMENHPMVGGLVIKEKPYSSSRSIMSQVKVFERYIVNLGDEVDENTIEAARFWRQSAYVLSGGINKNEVSFEEIQPTIRYLSKGGIIKKLKRGHMNHNEKHVTVRNLFMKKRYHFQHIHPSIDDENHGFMNAVKRWYFFRPYLYSSKSLNAYKQHPLLALAMFTMYFVLSLMAVYYMLKGKLLTRVTKMLHAGSKA